MCIRDRPIKNWIRTFFKYRDRKKGYITGRHIDEMWTVPKRQCRRQQSILSQKKKMKEIKNGLVKIASRRQ